MGIAIDREALVALEAVADHHEESRSAYWERKVTTFQVTTDGVVTGSTKLGIVSTKTGRLHTFVHWLLQTPFRFMGRRFRRYAECERLGRLIARRQGRQFTHDIVRQVLSLALVLEHADLEGTDDCNLVIGDGYGIMTSLLLLAMPHRRTIVVNLTKPLLLDLACVRQADSGLRIALVSDRDGMTEALADPDIRVIAVQADNAQTISEAPVGLAVNIVSMQEMTYQSIADYFRILRNNTAAETVFYCCNRASKKLYDGSEIEFEKYPWNDDDAILYDSLCPWVMWEYNKTPPFFSKMKRPTRHRLALLSRSG